nr:hypothetical protein [Paenibacillus sp. VMFN-D1]
MNTAVLSVGTAAIITLLIGASVTDGGWSVFGGSSALGGSSTLGGSSVFDGSSALGGWSVFDGSSTLGGWSALGESASLTAAAPELSGALSANAAAENATVCKTSIIAKQKESIALLMLRFRFKTLLSSIPDTTEIFATVGSSVQYRSTEYTASIGSIPTALCII